MLPIGDTVPRRSPPVAVWLLLIGNALVFVFELSMPPPVLERCFHLFGVVPARYTHPSWAAWAGLPLDDYWPFLTSMFLHGGWIHIVSNMWTLWIFGDNVEDRMGAVRFVAFYLLCGLAAGLVHVLANPYSTLPTVGASGAIAGVMGAYFVLFPTSRMIVMVPVLFFPFFFEIPAVTYLVVWVLSQLFSATLALGVPGLVGGVAWWAHVGGFVAGMALQFLFVKRGRAWRKLARDEYGVEAAWLPSNQWRR